MSVILFGSLDWRKKMREHKAKFKFSRGWRWKCLTCGMDVSFPRSVSREHAEDSFRRHQLAAMEIDRRGERGHG